MDSRMRGSVYHIFAIPCTPLCGGLARHRSSPSGLNVAPRSSAFFASRRLLSGSAAFRSANLRTVTTSHPRTALRVAQPLPFVAAELASANALAFACVAADFHVVCVPIAVHREFRQLLTLGLVGADLASAAAFQEVGTSSPHVGVKAPWASAPELKSWRNEIRR